MTTSDFSFPLNVFARLLERLQGQVDYLHFAVYEGHQRDVLIAQERASELLWQALPPPCRLLEVGIGLGTTLARLRAAGFDALGLTPEAAQIEVAQQRHGLSPSMRLTRLEDFTEQAGQWQAMLFQESAQYIDPVALFAAADRLLGVGPSHLVVMDEFALDRRSDQHTGLHHLDDFCALAQRCGWTLNRRIDLSQQVQPTLDYLIDHIRSLREALMADLGLSATVMDDLDVALRRSQDLYAQGVYGYALLAFERAQAPTTTVVRPDPADAGRAVRDLFGQVFGHELSAREWQWKYEPGRGVAMGLEQGGQLVAHCGGLTREVMFQGQRVRACQVCDVMVDASARAALNRNGPLYRLTASFLEAQIGWGRPHRLGFGFPTERAFAVAERLGLYAAVDDMVCLAWHASKPRLHSLAKGAGAWLRDGPSLHGLRADDLVPQGLWAAAVDALWCAMAAALPELTLAVRDADWVRHRYLLHPRLNYQVGLVRARRSGRLFGLVAVRVHEHHLEWVDWVGPPADWPRLLEAVRMQAAQLGKPMVEAWITRSQQHRLQSLAADTCQVRALAIQVPANAHTAGPSLEAQRNRWLLTAGDTDFR